MIQWKTDPPVDKEGSHAECPEDEVDCVVGQQPDLPLAVAVHPVREDVVVGDVPQEAGQAAHQTEHTEPDWRRQVQEEATKNFCTLVE